MPLVAGAVFLLALPVAAGLWVGLVAAPRERARCIARWQNQLAALADDRATAVERWIAAGLGDASLVASFPIVGSVTRGGTAAALAGERDHLDEILRLLTGPDRYRGAVVLDAGGRPIAGIGHEYWPDLGDLGLVRRSLSQGSALSAVELHGGVMPLVCFVAPVGGRNGGPPRGAVLLTDNPSDWLYPFLRHETVPTETGETLLAQQDGGEAVFLSPLRHDPAPPLTLRRPLSTPGLAAAAALTGHPIAGGLYVDYRGVPVLAVARTIRGAPWGLVVKVDRDEALAGYRHWLAVTLAAIAAALLAAGGLLFGAWSINRLRVRELAAASEQRLAELVHEANDAVFVLSLRGKVLQANRRAEELYGYSEDELRNMTMRDLRAPDARKAADELLSETAGRSGSVVETVHLRRDGSSLPVEVSIRHASFRGERFLIETVRDITVHKATEARIQRLNRLLRTISEVNQLIVRERDRARLLSEVCRILVEHGEFRMAWIGFADEATGLVVPAASAGIEESYLNSVTVRFDDTPLGRGATGSAIREGRRVLINDWDTDERVAPWREAARPLGYRGSGAFPLSVGGKVIGSLTVYVGVPGAFDSEISDLLSELAGDLGFALEALRLTAENRRAAAAVRESEERYRSLVEEAPVGMYRTTPAGEIVAANPALLRMLGYSTFDELASRDLSKEGYEPSYPREEFKRRMERSGGVRGFESGWLARDGRTVLVRENAQAIRRSDGSVAYYEGTVEDVTDLKRSEAARLKLGTAIEQAAEMIVITDREGRIEYVNPAFERTTGYNHAEVVGRKMSILKSGRQDAEFYANLWGTITEGRTWHGRFTNRRKDGSLFEAAGAVSPITGEDGTIVSFVAATRDITQEVALEDQIRQTQKMEAIGSLAGGVAHDFNNILQVLVSQLELLRTHADDPEHVRALTTELGQQISHGASLTRQLLLFSRRETAKLELLDLNRSVGDAASMLRRLVRANVALEVKLAPEPLLVTADRGQLEQVLLNLTVNAVDAMPKGGTLLVRTGALKGGSVQLSVEDTGVGIPDAIRERIFEPFVSSKGASKGTGLGLSVVHGIVTRHGGKIEVESVQGQGTVFRVILPAAEIGKVGAAAGSSQQLVQLPTGNGERILLVEDEEAAREALGDILRSLNYEVVAAASGEEAGRLTAERPFDLLLTDFMLPGISGPQLADGLRDRWPSLRTILMSGYTEDEAIRRGVGEGSVRFLQKPFGAAELAAEVRAALGTDPRTL